MATDGAANMEALITSHLQKKIFSEIYIKIQLKFYIFSEKQKKKCTQIQSYKLLIQCER
jgi:hypothetical protein